MFFRKKFDKIQKELSSLRDLARALEELKNKIKEALTHQVSIIESHTSTIHVIEERLEKLGERLWKFEYWEDIDACRRRNKKDGFSTDGETEKEVRERFQGSIEPCPTCQKEFKDMEILYFVSPPYTWKSMCGREGWMVICPDCKEVRNFELSVMN